ncbi:MAG: pyridoxamine 5'-phosphate oxidase family protein [Oscillospiraceae bacterium]|nr:pyridoxamine 5'-phosphate oxidase family protein [Oscillospiraceae bacterium]
MNMRHSDREIRDKEIIKAILDMCEVIDIGFFDDEYPYVLPVNFGYEYEDDLVFYTHHALDGYKNILVAKNPKVCVMTYKFIGHIYNDYDHSSHDYRSVMAFGEMSFIASDSEDYERAWRALGKSYGHTISDSLFAPEFKARILMAKIVCKPENVVGKAQRNVTSVDQVPFTIK